MSDHWPTVTLAEANDFMKTKTVETAKRASGSLDPVVMPRWHRYRFHANEDDPRPVKFPPPGPWWHTGSGDGYAIVVAYLPPKANLTDYWPEAAEVDYTEENELTFTDRFPKPDWWKGEAA